MNVVMIGSGNVATVLGRLIKNAGFEIVQVYSRSGHNAARLAEELGAQFTDQPENISRQANMYLLAIADQGLTDLAQFGNFGDNLVVHTAGSISKDVLEKSSSNYGVLYPLQSLRKEIKTLQQDIPFLIDGNNETVISGLEQFALTLSSSVQRATDEQRL
ncbi:MAG: NAD(P)-binding domain-containing protein, partial [Ferruginibacter sp.]|nr:NAD(P)-binding domain-containing protein [Ferruginibacter sp.]